MVAIIVDHLAFFPNGLDWWGMRGGLFVTAAEGFFLISGIVLGIVRGAKYIDRPMRDVTKALLSRGLQLYLTIVVLAILFTVIGWWYVGAGMGSGVKSGFMPVDSSLWSVIWSALSLQYYYGWADYLRLYALFLFVSPLVFWLLRRGKWYIALGGSLAVWALHPLLNTGSYASAEFWQPVSWQLIFFIGVLIGFHWNFFLDTWRGFSEKTQHIITISVVSATAATLLASVMYLLAAMGYPMGAFTSEARGFLFDMFFNKERLPLTRIALALLWFWAGFWVFHRFEKPIKKVLGWLLLPFGTNSLYVYTLHAFAVFFVHIYLVKGSLLWNFVVTAGVILVIRVMLHYRVLAKVIPR